MAAETERDHTTHRLAKGLATLAMLKAYFDSGSDHIDMLLPFVVDCVAAHEREDITAEEVRDAVATRYDIRVPLPTIAVVLSRSVKRGFVRREGGRYIRDNERSAERVVISSRRREIEAEQSTLARALLDYVGPTCQLIRSEEEALALLFQFINHFHVSLVLYTDREDAGLATLGEPDGLAAGKTHLVARFVLERCINNDVLARALRHAVEGFVLQNTLFLTDIASADRRFAGLRVYADTNFLLDLLGLTGTCAQKLAQEALEALRGAGAVVAVFDVTVAEIRRILGMLELKLGSQEGVRSLRQTDLVRHVLTQLRWTPSDAAGFSTLLPQRLHKEGLRVEPVPDYRKSTTLDERKLIQALRAKDQTSEEAEDDPRIKHDVRCVAAIITIRGGEVFDSFDKARAVFATKTGLVVRHVRDWYAAEGKEGVPPVVHIYALANTAWLKRPASGRSLTQPQLVALCSAALAPSPRVWDLFTKHLGKLCEAGELTDDEAVAILASSLTDRCLSKFDEDVEPDAATVREVIERVKEAHRAEARAELERQREEAQAHARAAEEEALKKVERAEKLRKEAEEQAKAYQEQAQREAAARREVRQRLEKVSRVVSGFIVTVFALAVITGPYLVTSRWWPQGWRIGASVVGLAFVVWTHASHICGWSLKDLYRTLANWLSHRMCVALGVPFDAKR